MSLVELKTKIKKYFLYLNDECDYYDECVEHTIGPNDHYRCDSMELNDIKWCDSIISVFYFPMTDVWEYIEQGSDGHNFKLKFNCTEQMIDRYLKSILVSMTVIVDQHIKDKLIEEEFGAYKQNEYKKINNIIRVKKLERITKI